MKIIKIKILLEGLATFLPGCSKITTKATSGTDSAKYCYSVWLRHCIKTRPFISLDSIDTILELGPGDSIGIGLGALLSGIKSYIALDVVEHADPVRNEKIFFELIDLFSKRTPIPEKNEFPEIKPHLDNYNFPEWLNSRIQQLSDADIQTILGALKNLNKADSPIKYISPVTADKIIPPKSIDLIFSQAVLEHVDHLASLYKNCFNWLAPGGIMSHQIDFKSHGTSLVWNGHWTYSSLLWKLIRGRRPYLINRQPCNVHLKLLNDAGFEIVFIERHKLESSIKPCQLAKEFSDLTKEDLTTAGAYIIAKKSEVD